ncbi:MAG: TraB/GumN family protein [Ruminococcus sp.]|nr:TraB/GumN family protein [Ruminococcus sp.]
MRNKKIAKAAALFCAVMMSVGMFTACTDREEGADTSSKAESQAEESKPEETTTAAPEESEPETVGTTAAADETVTDDETGEKDELKPAMWKVTGENGNELIMLGSMHALKESDIPFPDVIEDAYKNSDILALECKASTAQQDINYQSSLLAMVYYDDPADGLSKHISAEALQILDTYLQNYGMNAEAVETLMPWYVYMFTSQLGMAEADLSYEFGLDYYYEDKAVAEGKEIYEIESTDFQLTTLREMPDEVYDLIIRQLEDSSEEDSAETYTKLYTAWRHGDVDALGELADGDISEDGLSDEDLGYAEMFNNAMLYDRNVGMKDAAEEFLKGDKDVFMVVGAAHYVGEKGIIALLEKDGYTVERIQ